MVFVVCILYKFMRRVIKHSLNWIQIYSLSTFSCSQTTKVAWKKHLLYSMHLGIKRLWLSREIRKIQCYRGKLERMFEIIKF